jgi:23S rRNA pseudouridine1911/1915/1917 synthase
VAVARLCDVSRALAHKLIEDGLVLQIEPGTETDGFSAPRTPLKGAFGRQRRKPGDRLNGNETLEVRIPPPVPAEPQPQEIPLDILYEDDHLIIVNKPAGMAVHPGPGHDGDTLVNALLARFPNLPGINGVQRPGIVHRLDKDTSGVMAVAKTELAQRSLSDQLKERRTKKTYLALVEGRVEPAEAMIDAPLGRDPYNRLRQMVREHGGREAQTTYKVIEYLDGVTYLEASPITGRTHQIRVHFASTGHPIVGDTVYGRPSDRVPRQFLHAWKLRLEHPVSGESLEVSAPLAAELQASLLSFRGAASA